MTAGCTRRGRHSLLDLGMEDMLADAKQILDRLVAQVVGARGIEQTLDELTKDGLAISIHERAIKEERGRVF